MSTQRGVAYRPHRRRKSHTRASQRKPAIVTGSAGLKLGWYRGESLGWSQTLTRARDSSMLRSTDLSMPRRARCRLRRRRRVTLENTRTAAPAGAQVAVREESHGSSRAPGSSPVAHGTRPAREGRLARLAHFTTRYRWPVIAGWIVLTLFGGYAAGQLSTRWYQSLAVPGKPAYEASQRTLEDARGRRSVAEHRRLPLLERRRHRRARRCARRWRGW